MQQIKQRPTHDWQISYRWALDEGNRPIPIDQARRSGDYSCPLCKGAMIPRLGQQVAHHYGHERLTDCTPETVNRAVLRRWLAIHIQDALEAKSPVILRWQCQYCEQKHRADFLLGVTHFAEDTSNVNSIYADIALLGEGDELRGVILIQDAFTPQQEEFFARKDRYMLLLSHMATPDEDDLMAMLVQARVHNAPCPVLANMPEVIRDPVRIRALLMEVVARFPGYAYAAVESVNGVANLARLGGKLLLLSREQWNKIIGGSRNRIAPGVDVVIQTQQHPEGGEVYLYFITARDTQAVGIRRYSPGVTHTPEMDGRMYQRSTSALDIARHLVT